MVPVDTYSIVAIDKKSGEMGVAVQSHWFSVGSVVTWAEAGVGVVATQAFVEVSYGPLGPRSHEGREDPAAGAQVAARHGPKARGEAGRDARHAGDGSPCTPVAECIPEAGHVTGRGFSAQGNIMRNRRVWRAMASTFRRSKGSLAERLLMALESRESGQGETSVAGSPRRCWSSRSAGAACPGRARSSTSGWRTTRSRSWSSGGC